MILKILFLFSFFINFAEAKDFSEIVNQYVKMNQEKIKIVEQHRERIRGVEIIIADKAESFASRFGHGMLRLVDDDNTWVNDAVVSFSALSYDEKYSIRRSLFGGYTILPQVMTMYEYWNMYTNSEERDLKRFVINLPKKELDQFLNTLFKYLKDPEQLDNYTFLSNNCIGVITKIFVEAGVTKSKKTSKVPTNIGRWIEKNEFSLYPEFVMKNYASVKAKAETLNISKMPVEELIKHFTLPELNYLYLNNNELEEEKIDFLAALLKEQFNLDEAFSFNRISSSLYNRCQDDECFKKFAEIERSSLTEEDLLQTIAYRLESKHQYLQHYLQYLEYQEQTLARINLQGVRFESHHIEEKNGKYTLVLEFRQSNNNHAYQTERLALPQKNSGKIAVIESGRKLEIKLISLN